MVVCDKNTIVRTILTIVFTLSLQYSYSQEDASIFNNTFSSINKKHLFKRIEGTFFDKIIKDTINGEIHNRIYIYDKEDIQYIITDSCDVFSVFGKVVIPSKLYDEDISACEYDETSLAVYKGFFLKRKYILITGINNGSGACALNVFCMLFDISDSHAVKFYPLWSKYGGTSCFGDFNNDGKLDFLKVRENNNQLKMILRTLDGDKFREYDDKHYIIAQKTRSGIRIIKRNWW